jgi:hypothetical protein
MPPRGEEPGGTGNFGKPDARRRWPGRGARLYKNNVDEAADIRKNIPKPGHAGNAPHQLLPGGGSTNPDKKKLRKEIAARVGKYGDDLVTITCSLVP